MKESYEDITSHGDIVFSDWISAAVGAFQSFSSSMDIRDVCCISLMFSPPRRGRIVLQVCRDSEPPFPIVIDAMLTPLDDLISWLERLMRYNSIGRNTPHSICLDSGLEAVTITLVHRGWMNPCSPSAKAVSVLTVHRSGSPRMQLSCLCITRDVVREFYRALRHAVDSYSALFDEDGNWPSVGGYGHIHCKRSNSDEIRRMLDASVIRYL